MSYCNWKKLVENKSESGQFIFDNKAGISKKKIKAWKTHLSGHLKYFYLIFLVYFKNTACRETLSPDMNTVKISDGIYNY